MSHAAGPEDASHRRLDFDERAMLGVLFLLGVIALALAAIATLMYWQFRADEVERTRRQAAAIDTRETAESGASAALAKLLADRGMPKDEVDRLARAASRLLLQDIAGDRSGVAAQKFDEWIRASSAASDAADAKAKSAAVWPYVQSALQRAAQSLGLSAKSAGIVASLSADALDEIGKGFFGGLGGLPWEFVKHWMTRGPDDQRPIIVNCAACAATEAKPGQPVVSCPNGGPAPTGCPNGVVREVEIHFAPDQHRLASPTQRAQVDLAARYALASDDTTVLLWAYADTTAPETHNLYLARRRASEVHRALVGARVPSERIRVAPMGEYAPPVRTADNVPEAKNRVVRVEVRLRAEPAATR